MPLSWCSFSYARLSGELEWGYGEYHADADLGQKVDASYFSQRYALFTSHEGVFMDGRGGHYDLSLGGEWWGLNRDVNNNGVDNNISVDNSKLMYRGEVIFAPGGLPLQFRAYGRDMSRSSFVKDSFFSMGTFDKFNLSPMRKSVLSPNIVSDVINGKREEYGASLIVGIKNGSYLGRYRNVLSHLPKLYIDYREIRVTDMLTRSPRKYVDRELAFVSLNKKHNWFHYRFNDHIDSLDSLNSRSERSYLLGTVDNHLRREWINLTNWIQLSTDGRYTEYKNRSRAQAIEHEYALNMFFLTDRRDWTSALLTSYTRFERLSTLERRLNVPFYASGNLGRNNLWRFRMQGNRELSNNPFAIVSNEIAKDNLYLNLRWETNRISPYIFAQDYQLEGKFGDRGEGGAIRLFYEYYTNAGYGGNASRYDLFSRLSVAYFRGASENNVSLTTPLDTDLFEMTGKFDLARRLSPRVRVGFVSLLNLGVGRAVTGTTDYVQPVSIQSFKASQLSGNTLPDGTSWRIDASFFLEHISLSRLTNRLESGIEYQDTEAGGAGQYYLLHHLGYSVRQYEVKARSEVLYGDAISRGVNSQVFGSGLVANEYSGFSFSNESDFSYTPNRNHLFAGRVNIEARLPDNSDYGYRVALTQDYRFTHYLQRGVVRRLFELFQIFDYERLIPGDSRTYNAFALTGVANYYPTSWSRLGCKVKWQNNLHVGSSDVGFGLYSDLNFSLLSVGLEYEQGMRSADNTGAILGQDEQRWSVSIRKIF